MQSFENRTLQLETTPKTRISEYSVTPQEDEGNSPTAPPTAWTNAPSQLNPDRDKIFNFSTKTSYQNFSVNLASAPRFLFGTPTNQVVFPMAGPRALSQLNPDRDEIFGFSASKNFQGASGATTSAWCQVWSVGKFASYPGVLCCPILKWSCVSSVSKERVRCYFDPGLAQASSHAIMFH